MWLIGILVAIAIATIASIFNEKEDFGGIAIIVLLALSCLDKSMYSYVMQFDILSYIKFLAQYIAIGFIVSTVEWGFIIRKIKDKLNLYLVAREATAQISISNGKLSYYEAVYDFCRKNYHLFKSDKLYFNHDINGYSGKDATDDMYREEVSKILPPRYLSHKYEIISATLFWPLIIAKWLCYKLINFIVKQIANGSEALYNKISSLIFGKF